MKHICILICYFNFEHIKKCFNSLKNDNIDFFIVENKSRCSEEIKEFFLQENLKGYIQFVDNITFKAMEIFVRDYYELLKEYDYITFSDCDLQVENSVKVFEEIKSNLDFENVFVSCVDLSMINFPNHVNGSHSWLPNKIRENERFIECNTGIHLSTIRANNLHLFSGIFLDSEIIKGVYKFGGIWVKTKFEKAIHLTWDLYFEGSEYYNFKKNKSDIWNHNRVCEYKKII